MSETVRKRIMYGVLVLAVLWGVYNLDFGADNPDPSPAGASRTAVETKVQQTSPPSQQVDIARHESAPWGADPFRVIKRTRKAPTVRPEWNLKGIIFNNERPMAIINNRTLMVGQTVEGATITSIDKHRVLLNYSGERITLKVTGRG